MAERTAEPSVAMTVSFKVFSNLSKSVCNGTVVTFFRAWDLHADVRIHARCIGCSVQEVGYSRWIGGTEQRRTASARTCGGARGTPSGATT